MTVDVMDPPETNVHPDSPPVLRPESTAGRIRWIVAGAVALFLVLGFTLFRSTGQDDCYISYWPAHTLAKYGRIANYNGEAVEQSSSMLWVLVMGLVSFISRAPVPFVGPLLSIACGGLAIVLASRLASRLDKRAHTYTLFIAATSTYLVYWSFSGMESSLTAVCTTWLAVAYADHLAGLQTRKWEVVAASLACILVRPEMGAALCLMLFLLAATLWIRRRNELLEADKFRVLARRVGLIVGTVIGLSALLAAIRYGLFHSLLPEPALVKGGKQPHIQQGLQYVWESCIRWWVFPIALLTLIGIAVTIKDAVAGRAVNLTRLVCTMLLVAYTGFVVWVGGDWMLAGRFLVHVLPVALVLAADTLARISPRRIATAVAYLIILIQLGGVVRSAAVLGVGTATLNDQTGLTWFDRSNRLFLRDAQVVPAVDRVLTRLEAVGYTKPKLFSGQMGIVMYTLASSRFGKIDVTDRHGLADNRFAACSIANDRPRLTNGLSVDYAWYLSHRTELQQTCGIPLPDVIYDIEDARSLNRAKAIKGNGYALVFHRVLDVPQNSGLIRGSPVALDEYIAVRRELLPSLRLREVAPEEFADGTL